jgi:mono/diheme cytochrome c family protein
MSNSTRIRWTLGALAAVAMSIALASTGAAEQAAERKIAYSAAAGAVTYRSFCGNCHGPQGEGDGYIADTLRQKPTDLTRLAARNDGEFPEDRVRATIDGRAEVKSHGRREMPLWGDIFLWPEGDTPERRAHVERKIGELVAFVRSLQKAAEPEG